MLPITLASLCFLDCDVGSDAALAARTHAILADGRVMLLGASRPGLVRALATHALDIVVVDSSRSALQRLSDELAGDPAALLLAADPRELEIPGGVDAMLVPSAHWRAVVLETDRRHVLRGMEKELRPGGLLLLELERLPVAPESWGAVPSAMPGAEWQRAATSDTVVVRRGADEVTFATFTPETAIHEALTEGFTADDAAADTPSEHVWATLRTTRGRR